MRTLIILHGWQSSKEKWQKVKENLEKQDLKVVVPDIPGFKPATSLKIPWTLDDYVDWLRKLTEARPLLANRGRASVASANGELTEPFFLLGHSFGGRISIKFAEKFPQKLKGLILVSAAGIKRDSFFKKSLGWGAKLIKKLKIEDVPLLGDLWQFFRKLFYIVILGKTDYLRTSGALKETIKNVLAEDLAPLLDKIFVPTLIIWGKKDKITPLKDGYLMKEKIRNSKLEILEGVGHTPHLECPEVLTQKIKTFISSTD